ncbi:MAG: peptidylprolyl isomerase [Alphaproteobacteria bacterium]|jgi:peptidylprolyl isomerase|nr:peptidylprolyl isomerase [Alphaproteobacteria bacterium]
MSKVIGMLVNFAKVFICFLILILSPAMILAAEGDAPTATNGAANNSTTGAANTPATPATVPATTNGSNGNGNNIITLVPLDPNSIATETTTEQDPTPASKATSNGDIANSVINSTSEREAQRRRPVVSISEISKAIDEDYSFLYDPNMRPELIKDMTDNPNNYVIMYLETGNAILIKLKEDIAPNTVIRFRQLVKDKFYDDMEIFRAIPDYLAQMGDPSGSGFGGKGIFYFAEINPDEKFRRGTVAMSNNGDLQSDDTQFFITFNTFPWLDGKFTIFGEVILGMTVLEDINKSLQNDGFVSMPAIVNKMELLSDRPSDRVDDLSVLIPVDKKAEALKKQKEAQKLEKARQQVLIEQEEQAKATSAANIAAMNEGKVATPASTTNNNATTTTAPDTSEPAAIDENSSIDEEEQQGDNSNPYLRSRG